MIAAVANIRAFADIAQRVLNDAPFGDAERLALSSLRSEWAALEAGLTAKGVLFATPFNVELPNAGDAALLEIGRLAAENEALRKQLDALTWDEVPEP